MVAAPVGFQCPDCSGHVPGPRSHKIMTALPRGADGKRHPRSVMRNATVTWVVVGLCGFGFLLELVAGSNAVFARFGMVPLAVADGELWRLLTSVFLHAGLLHLAFNMLVLIMIGPALEAILGHLRFVVLYVLSAIGGAVFSYALSAPLSLSVGASGAIFGLMGGLVVAGRKLSIDITQVAVLIAINLVISFLPGVGIDWRAHVGGLVTGAVTGAVLAHSQGRHRNLVQAAGCTIIAAFLLGVVLWRGDSLRSNVEGIYTSPSTLTSATSQRAASINGSPAFMCYPAGHTSTGAAESGRYPQLPPTLGRTTRM